MQCVQCDRDNSELYLASRVAAILGVRRRLGDPDTGDDRCFYLCHDCMRQRRRLKIALSFQWSVIVGMLLFVIWCCGLSRGVGGMVAIGGGLFCSFPLYLLVYNEIRAPFRSGLPMKISTEKRR